MKKVLTTAAILAAMTLPVLAEGDDPSTAAGEPKGSVKATTDMKQDQPGSGAMGQGALRRSTTGAGSSANQLNKEENSSPANPGQKTGVSGGADGGGSGGSGGSGGGADSR